MKIVLYHAKINAKEVKVGEIMLSKYLALLTRKQNKPEQNSENHTTLTREKNHDDTHNMNRYKYNFEEYVSEVTSAVARFGFLPKGKNTLVRQTEHCIQRINFIIVN